MDTHPAVAHGANGVAPNPNLRRCVLLASALLWFCASGCGNYPQPLNTGKDVASESPATESVLLGALPLSEYGNLKRLQNLRTIDFYVKGRSGADDAKLKAFADLGLTNVEGIGLLGCSAVSDDGILSLSRLPSLRWIQLEGTSITDKGLGVIASNMSLTALNAANCPKTTSEGIIGLARLGTLRDLSFSSSNMTSTEVVDLMAKLPQVTEFYIVDLAGKLDVAQVENYGSQRKLKVLVQRSGALQDIGQK